MGSTPTRMPADHLTHRYFDTDHSIVADVVDNELDPLLSAVRSLAARLTDGS